MQDKKKKKKKGIAQPFYQAYNMDTSISWANKRAITNTSKYRIINLIKTQKQWVITIVLHI